MNTTEVLLRQVHPKLRDNGKLASSVFVPNPSDNGLLSSDRSTLTTPAAAFQHYTQHVGKQSCAVFGLEVQEYADEAIACTADPLAASGSIPANPAHALSDFTAHDPRCWKNIAKRLKIKAEERGCFYP